MPPTGLKGTGIYLEQPVMQNPGLLRFPYVLLLGAFIVSRATYYLLGVRFDAEGLGWYFQFLDPELLRHDLLQSLFYLHMQPPGYNLFLGVVLKLFPHAYTAAFHAIHLAFGAAITGILFHLMRCLGAGVRLSLVATILFMVSPGVVLFENLLFYEYQMIFFLVVSAMFLFRFFVRYSAASAIGFLACQFWLVMLRNQYHLVYFIAVVVLLVYFTKRNRTLVTGVGSVLLAVVLALYLKNLILFGHFEISTWLGMNISSVTTHQLTAEEAESFVSQGKISPVSTARVGDNGAPVAAYRPYITMPAKTSIRVLDQELKSTGAANLNHLAYLQVQKLRMKDGLFIIRHYPIAYVRSILIAWFTYFLPPSDFPFFEHNLTRIRGVERFFDIIFYGQFKQAPHKALRQLHAQGAGLSLVLYTGIFIMIGLPMLFVFGVRFLYRGIRRRSLDPPHVLLLGFLLFNIFYLTMISNFLGCFENNRYRFPLDGFFLVLAVLALEQVWRRLKRRPV